MLVVLVVLVLQALAVTDSGQVAERERGSFCDIHRGQSAWDAICEEARRGR